MALRVKATAISFPWARRESLARFELPGVSLRSRNFAPRGRDAILIFGGDGTINMHLQELVAIQTPLLVVPTGAGNDFACALGIRSVADALAAWKRFCDQRDNVRSVDLGIITDLCGGLPARGRQTAPSGETVRLPRNQVYFCCVGGAGLDAEANRRANAMPRWLRGRGGYLLGALGAIRSTRPQHFTVETLQATSLQKRISEPGLMVAFANAPAYGHGMKIAPRAHLDDGKLDIVFVRNTGKLRVLRMLPRVYSGTHTELPEVEYFPAERLRVETEAPVDVYADGEYICQTPVEVSISPRALQVITPITP